MLRSVIERDRGISSPVESEFEETIHDVKNLLFATQMMMNLVRNRLSDGEASRLFEHIERATGEVGQLIGTLIPGGYTESMQRSECIDLAALIEDSKPLLMASANDSTLSFEFGTIRSEIQAISSHIRQVLTNLVLNASQSIDGRSGLIVVSTGTCDLDETSRETIDSGDLVAGNYSYFEVSDNGCGMDEVTQARLSEPYFTTKRTGHGLGMASVRRIVTAHGGTIQIQSRRGAGTRIRVLFPGSERQETDFQVSEDLLPDNGHIVAREPAGTVLMVDDDRSIRMLAGVMLESRGWRVLTAASGEAALEQLQLHQGQISAVLLDNRMSGMDGFETLQRFRQIDSEVPVIILSGSCEQDLASHFGSELPSAFLLKPFSIDDLTDVITAAIADALVSHDRSDQNFRPIGSEPATSNASHTIKNESILMTRRGTQP